jgi:CDP-6-deoxy-D-xylo-4-hexulose-3-dehydrase
MDKDLEKSVQEEFFRRRQSEIKDFEKTITVGFPVYDEKEVIAALDCLLNLRLSQGPIVKQFEIEAAEYMDVPHAVAVNSGTSANMLALASLMNLGMINPGDEVIVPAATFSSVVSPIYQLGLVPVYVDVEETDWFMSIDEVSKAISSKTKVIMPVYNLGFPGEIEKIVDIADKKNIKILEDCCEAHGGERKGIKLGAYGDLSALSFFVAHNITTGEGGMVFSSDEEIDNKLRELREFGRLFETKTRYYSDNVLSDYDVRYVSKSSGYNVRMTDVAASMGRVQLSKLDSLNKTRRQVVSKIVEIIDQKEWLSTISVREGDKSAHYGVPILIDGAAPFSRKEICTYLEAKGIETRALMMGCLPDQPAFRDLNHKISGDLKFSRVLRDKAFFIGCHPALNDGHISHLKESLKSFYDQI